MKSFVIIVFILGFSLNTAKSDANSAQASDRFEKIQAEQIKTLSQQAKSQKLINSLDNSTSKLVAEYRAVLAQIESLKKYNMQMSRLIAAQKKEKTNLRRQIKNSDNIDRHILPLMSKMIYGLEEFISLDMPFLLAERRTRIVNLHALMESATAHPAEKFRKIFSAYEIEIEYGRTIETWQGELRGDNRVVDFLRLGRLSLIYQTFNRNETALWAQDTKKWSPLSGWSRDIDKAIKVAKKQAPPSLLLLPIKEMPR